MEGGGEKPRFIADAMLGSLARWLRTLGCDAEYASDADDMELVKRAIADKRILLTRDTGLAARRAFRDTVLFIRGDDVEAQLRQVVEAHPVGLDGFLTRCIRCNRPLDRVGKEAVKGRVPDYVLETQNEFKSCASCGRLYWAGTHRDKMLKTLESMLSAQDKGGVDGK